MKTNNETGRIILFIAAYVFVVLPAIGGFIFYAYSAAIFPGILGEGSFKYHGISTAIGFGAPSILSLMSLIYVTRITWNGTVKNYRNDEVRMIIFFVIYFFAGHIALFLLGLVLFTGAFFVGMMSEGSFIYPGLGMAISQSVAMLVFLAIAYFGTRGLWRLIVKR